MRRLTSLFPILFTVLPALAWQSNAELIEYLKLVASKPSSSLYHFRLGEFYLRQNNFQSAATEFNSALHGDLQPGWTEVWSHIDMGRAFDFSGDRGRAVSEYQQAWSLGDDTFSAAAWARNGLIAPGMPGDSFPVRLPENLDDLVSPVVLTRTEPVYSEEAKRARLEGEVVVSVVVGADGVVVDTSITSPLGLGLDEAAAEAASQWRFRPGTLRGLPTAQATHVQVHFGLNDSSPGWRTRRIEFNLEEGARRPVLKSVGASQVPADPQLADAIRMNDAMGRVASATIAFEIGTDGVPGKFQPTNSSGAVWSRDAIREISVWRFRPASDADGPTPVRCVVTMIRIPGAPARP